MGGWGGRELCGWGRKGEARNTKQNTVSLVKDVTESEEPHLRRPDTKASPTAWTRRKFYTVREVVHIEGLL